VANKEVEALLNNSISVWFSQNVEPYKVTLSIASEIEKYFKPKPISKSQVIKSLSEDGSMVVTVDITNDMEIIPLVKYLMPYIQVVELKRIEQAIEKDLQRYLRSMEQ
jgi:predicted DNA-binding transcriptional regulator YafY